jgi:site-specific DNA recombinase
MSEPQTLRCAIYTRKSSEEGLEQDFNSLDAQREACEAYIASQRHEGWKLLPARYDDGGKSGGTLERPALQRLLDDVEAGRIDLVVVYKVDRLTRSLADFAKLVDRLDAKACSFVSVTQAFNTSTSMGRLTLNVLLSFAQFEREVTAERIRDKLAQSKAKGLWMGGYVPLGYSPNGRTLEIVPDEAATVQRLFALYDELGCLGRVETAAKTEGLRTKPREADDPKMRGNKPFSRGRIQNLLRNPLYIGRIRHKDKSYPGQHPAIIDEALFNRVQTKLTVAAQRNSTRKAPQHSSLLAGKIFDGEGKRLTPSHTTRGERRFRYYVSRCLVTQSGASDRTGIRLPASALEDAVHQAVSTHLLETQTALATVGSCDVATLQARTDRITTLAAAPLKEQMLLISRIEVGANQLAITLDPDALSNAIGVPATSLPQELFALTADFTQRRRGVEARLILGKAKPQPDRLMQRTLGKALAWLDDIQAGVRVVELSRREGITPRYMRNRLQMAFLSPRIMTAILEGTQPAHLSTETFVRANIPLDWSEQERLFGFTA